jgi:hypothetical protein
VNETSKAASMIKRMDNVGRSNFSMKKMMQAYNSNLPLKTSVNNK